MTRSIRIGRKRTGYLWPTAYPVLSDTNFHIETQGQNQGEVHIPMSALSASVAANPEILFTPLTRYIAAIDDDFENPVRFAGVITKVKPIWDAGKIIIILGGENITLGDLPAVAVEDREGNDNQDRVWEISGASYEDMVNHLLSTTTNETGDGLKLPQCYGDLSYTTGDVKLQIPLATPPRSVWDILEDLRTGDDVIETVFVPKFTDSAKTHIYWDVKVGSKANPHFRKDESLGIIDLADADGKVVGYNYLNDGPQKSPNWYYGSSNAFKKGDDNFSDLIAKWVPAPDNDPEFMHRSGGGHYDSELSIDELQTQIDARLDDSKTWYKVHEVNVFDTTFYYTQKYGCTMRITDSSRMDGLNEDIRITGVDWQFFDPSTVKLTVQPKDLHFFPRVPRHITDPRDHGGGGGKNHPTDVAPQIVTRALPQIYSGVPYQTQISATGTPNPTFKITDGDLPAGLTMSTSGRISGTTNAIGDGYTFTVMASNRKGKDTATYNPDIKTKDDVDPFPGYGDNSVDENIIDGYGEKSIPIETFAPHTGVQKGNEIYFLSHGGQAFSKTWGNLGGDFDPILVRRVKLDNQANALDHDDVVGIIAPSLLEDLRDQIADSSVDGYDRESEMIMIDTVHNPVNNRLFIFFTLAVTFSGGDPEQSEGVHKVDRVKYTTEVYSCEFSDAMNDWVKGVRPVLASYPGAFWRPKHQGAVAWGENQSTVGFVGVEMLRPSGYSGSYDVASQKSAYFQKVMEMGFSNPEGDNNIWVEVTPPPYQNLVPQFDTVQPHEQLAAYVGADGWLYVVNMEYGEGQNKYPTPDGNSVYKTYVKNGFTGKWIKVTEGPTANQKDDKELGTTKKGIQRPRAIAMVGGRVVYTHRRAYTTFNEDLNKTQYMPTIISAHSLKLAASIPPGLNEVPQGNQNTFGVDLLDDEYNVPSGYDIQAFTRDSGIPYWVLPRLAIDEPWKKTEVEPTAPRNYISRGSPFFVIGRCVIHFGADSSASGKYHWFSVENA